MSKTNIKSELTDIADSSAGTKVPFQHEPQNSQLLTVMD